MPWVKLDERFRHNPKAIRIGPLGRDLYVCGLQYCNENLTDGFICDDMVPHLAPGQPRPAKLAGLLLDAGLWTREEGGYRVHDYLKYQPSARQVLAERDAAKTRKERWKEQRRNAVPNGHGTVAEQAPRTRPDPKDIEAVVQALDAPAATADPLTKNGIPIPPKVLERIPELAAWPSAAALLALWNFHAEEAGLPAAETLSDKRRVKAGPLLRQFPDWRWWNGTLSGVKRSAFLSGKVPPTQGHSKPFRADFDWMLSTKDGVENIVRLHDGKYA